MNASAFDSLTNLTRLDLSGNNALTSLPVGVFDSLTSLTNLYLDNNDALTSLPVGVFDGLTSLTYLYLYSNDALTSLPVGVFDGLTSLTYLDLEENYALTSLLVGVFDGLSSLTSLSLGGSYALTSLPVGVFDGLSSLTYLNLGACLTLTSLPVGVFDGLTSLTRLDLCCNDALANLPEGVFDGLTSLTSLWVGGGWYEPSGLTSLPVGVFDGLSSLTSLNLGGNHALANLPVGVFDNLTSLTHLYLDCNDALTSLPVGVFDGLTSLTLLDLSDNGALTSLPEGVFDSLTSLTILRTSGSSFANSCLPSSTAAFDCSMQDGPLPSSPQLCMCQRCPISLPLFNETISCHGPYSCSGLSGSNPFILQERAVVNCSGTDSCTDSTMFCTRPAMPGRCNISCTGSGSCAGSTLYGAWNCSAEICPPIVDVVCLPGQGKALATPSPTPSSSATASPTVTPSLTPSASGTALSTQSATPTLSGTPSHSASVTTSSTVSGTPTHSASVTTSSTVSGTPTHSASVTTSSTVSGTPSHSASVTASSTVSGTPSHSASVTATSTVTRTPSHSVSVTVSSTVTETPFPSPAPTPQPSTPRSAWALTQPSFNRSSAPYTVPRFPAQLACAKDCSSPRALVLPCPRPGSCLPHTDVRLLTACQPGHRGLACQACDDGWAATSPCTTCRQCPFNGVAPGVVKAGATVAQIALGLAMSLFAVHGYARAPDRVATSLFSGGLRLAMWYIGMAGQVALLAADMPGTLQATAHTLGHWADVCGMAQPWREGQDQTLPPNGTMYASQPEPVQGVDVLGILGALTGRAGVATMPSAGCLVGGGDSRSPHDMANIVMAVYGGVLLCVSAAVLWCARPAPGKTWTTLLLLLAPAAYMQMVPSVIQGQARVVGLQPVWRGMSSPDDVAGHAADVGGYAASLTLQCLAATVGVLSVLAWRQWRRSGRLLARSASVPGFCSKGYRMQYTPQQVVLLARATGADDELKAAAVAAARANEGACCGAGRLLPTHAFPALQMTLVVLVAVMGSMTTSVVARLVCVGVGVAGSMALVQHRQPWALAELSDLDVLAHGGILVQVVCVGLGTAGGGLATAASIISGIGHVLVLLWLAMAVARGYSGRVRELLVRVGRRLRAWLPDLGPVSAGSGGSGQLGDVTDSQVPGVGSIVWALVQRCVRRGEVRPGASRPASDVLSVLSMVQEQGLTVEAGMADVVGDSGSALVVMPAGSGLKRVAPNKLLAGQFELKQHPLQSMRSGTSTFKVLGTNPMLQVTGADRQPLRVERPAIGVVPQSCTLDSPNRLPKGGMPRGGQQTLPPKLPDSSTDQRHVSAAGGICSQKSDAGQGAGDPYEALALAFARNGDRRMSGGRRMDGRGRVSFTAARPQRMSLRKGRGES